MKCTLTSIVTPIALALSLSVGLSACEAKPTEPAVTKTSPAPIQTFSVEQSSVTQGGSLQVNLPEEVPSNLAIISPDGEFFIVHSADDDVALLPEDMKALSSGRLTVDTASQTGAIWVDGEKTVSKIFTKPGVYELYLANNLETEPTNTFSLSQKVTIK